MACFGINLVLVREGFALREAFAYGSERTLLFLVFFFFNFFGAKK